MLEKSIESISGIGRKKSEILNIDAGIETIEDLLYYLPRKYADRSSFKKISDCFVNETATVAGTIKDKFISGSKKKFLEIVIDDGTDSLSGIFFGGIQYFQKIFEINDYVIFSGKINFFKRKQITHPDFDFLDEDSNLKFINTGRIVPLYRSTEKMKTMGLDSRGIRRLIKTSLDAYLEYIHDPVDNNILKKYSFMPLKDAIFSIHFPDNFEKAESARRRLAFNEIFLLQYFLALIKKSRPQKKISINLFNDSLYKMALDKLPFKLTDDQKKTTEEIKIDLLSAYPMTRLLQGDVGSGKTVVSMLASMIALSRGDQVAVMAPTEILSIQHYHTFRTLSPESVNIALLTGNTSKKEKQQLKENLFEGKINILIGTHALIQGDVKFKKLGLIIIDEQQRFGVEQRSRLRGKGSDTDLLVMTATPIPRTLSMTLFGDMDISSIKQKPSGREKIITLSFPESRLKGVYNSIEKYISQGRQIYYVLPLIEESEKIDLKSAIKTYETLKEKIFTDRKVSLIHGKMKQNEKTEIMEKYKKGEIDLLVSTTVIEVGIDVPNASVIIIEHSERYGLSQLHQLRGRVGRGAFQSFCVLIYGNNISDESKKRIDIITNTDDGFLIAEEDLKMRGSGELTGTIQHGKSSDFEFTNLSIDLDIIQAGRDEAIILAESETVQIEDIENIINSAGRSRFGSIRKKRILSILS